MKPLQILFEDVKIYLFYGIAFNISYSIFFLAFADISPFSALGLWYSLSLATVLFLIVIWAAAKHLTSRKSILQADISAQALKVLSAYVFLTIVFLVYLVLIRSIAVPVALQGFASVIISSIIGYFVLCYFLKKYISTSS